MKNDSWNDLTIPGFLKRDKNDPPPDWKPRPPEQFKPRIEPDAAVIAAFERDNEAKPKPKLKDKTFDLETHRWDTVHNQWVPIRIYHKESQMRLDFTSMDTMLLKQAYNEMAVTAARLDP